MLVGDLLERVSSEELAYWYAYAQCEAEDWQKKQLDAQSQQNLQRRKLK